MIDIAPTDIVACICEGESEITIMNYLIDNNFVCFSREQLLTGKVLEKRYKKSLNFQNDYLTLDYEGKKIVILDIKDRQTSFKIAAPYDNQLKSINCIITHPELEMLMIHALGILKDFKKQKDKPSIFLQNKFKITGSSLKSNSYLTKFYKSHSLVDAIKEHKRVSISNNGYYFLADILR